MTSRYETTNIPESPFFIPFPPQSQSSVRSLWQRCRAGSSGLHICTSIVRHASPVKEINGILCAQQGRIICKAQRKHEKPAALAGGFLRKNLSSNEQTSIRVWMLVCLCSPQTQCTGTVRIIAPSGGSVAARQIGIWQHDCHSRSFFIVYQRCPLGQFWISPTILYPCFRKIVA